MHSMSDGRPVYIFQQGGSTGEPTNNSNSWPPALQCVVKSTSWCSHNDNCRPQTPLPYPPAALTASLSTDTLLSQYSLHAWYAHRPRHSSLALW